MVTTEDSKLVELRSFMKEALAKEKSESALISILHRAQDLYGYLNTNVMDEIALTMNIPTAHIWGVATFYHYFNLTPQGKHTISVCLGTACYIKGSAEILEKIKQELGVEVGETSQDGLFTLQEARCLGACGLAPVAMIDGKIYGQLTTKKISEIIQSYRKSSK